MSRRIFQNIQSARRCCMASHRNYVTKSFNCLQLTDGIRKENMEVNQEYMPNIFSRREENPMRNAVVAVVPATTSKRLNILLLSSAYNGMTQRIEGELLRLGHRVNFQLADSAESMRQAEDDIRPNLIICPTLMTAIPKDIYKRVKCLIVHPGIKGDRGPSSLDWAILDQKPEWGVTVLEASKEMDGGNIWATLNFPVPANTSKTGLYNSFVVHVAARLVIECVSKYLDPDFKPEPLNYSNESVNGKLHETIRQSHGSRIADFRHDSSKDILRKMLAADSQPGLKATLRLHGEELTRFLYGGYSENNLNSNLSFEPGTVIVRRDGAICVATRDGAVWVSQLRSPKTAKDAAKPLKLPATLQLGNATLSIPCAVQEKLLQIPNANTFQEISFQTKGTIGFLSFNFYNGAMSTAQCHRLLDAIREIGSNQSLQALVLIGSPTSWSNGIHLGQIHGSSNPAAEAYANICAINEVVKGILSLTHLVTVSAIQANAGAGGVYLGLATDFSFARSGIVLNPHYKNMGLYGSELHTYITRRRLRSQDLFRLKESARPLLSEEAVQIGLIDNLGQTAAENNFQLQQASFLEQVHQFTTQLVSSGAKFQRTIDMKTEKYEQEVGLRQSCEEHELGEMYKDIFDNRNYFAERREAFLAKKPFKLGQRLCDSLNLQRRRNN